MRIQGEIVALAPQPDEQGAWRLVAVASTEKGLVAGVLVAPEGGGTGQIGFHPVESMQHVATAVARNLGGRHDRPAPFETGTLTSEAVPSRGPAR